MYCVCVSCSFAYKDCVRVCCAFVICIYVFYLYTCIVYMYIVYLLYMYICVYMYCSYWFMYMHCSYACGLLVYKPDLYECLICIDELFTCMLCICIHVLCKCICIGVHGCIAFLYTHCLHLCCVFVYTHSVHRLIEKMEEEGRRNRKRFHITGGRREGLVYTMNLQMSVLYLYYACFVYLHCLHECCVLCMYYVCDGVHLQQYCVHVCYVFLYLYMFHVQVCCCLLICIVHWIHVCCVFMYTCALFICETK